MAVVSQLIPGPREVAALRIAIELDDRGRELERMRWEGLDEGASPLNASLLLQRYLPSPLALELVQADEPLPTGASESLKRLRLEEWVRLANQARQLPAELRKALLERLARGARTFKATTASRLLVGCGMSSVFEIGIDVHPLYGIPVIVGSALKGVARSAIDALVEESDTVGSMWRGLSTQEAAMPGEVSQIEEQPATACLDAIFGSAAGARADGGLEDDAGRCGSVAFRDALSTDAGSWYELEVITPHYGAYYGGTAQFPSDHVTSLNRPIPVLFPVVRQDVGFQFALAAGAAANLLTPAVRIAHVLIAERLIQFALTMRGVGAKTAAGFGYFKLG